MWYLLNYSLTLYVLAPCGPSVCSFLPFFFFFVFALTPATRRRRGRRMRREASMPADRPQLLVPRVPVRGTPLSSFFFFFYSSSNLLSPATSLLVSFLPSPPKPFFSPGVLARLCNVRRPCAGGHLTPRTGTLTSQHPPSRPPSVLLFFFFFLPPLVPKYFLPCQRNCPTFSHSPSPALLLTLLLLLLLLPSLFVPVRVHPALWEASCLWLESLITPVNFWRSGGIIFVHRTPHPPPPNPTPRKHKTQLDRGTRGRISNYPIQCLKK